MLQVERLGKTVKPKAGDFIFTSEQRPQCVQNVNVEVQAILDDGVCVSRLALKS